MDALTADAARPRRNRLRLLGQLRSVAAAAQTSGLYFAVTMTLAALLALFVAFRLELDSPATAMTTVLIVAAPIRGMVLSKSLYRLLGTFVGGVATLALVDLCGQYSQLFILAVALWVGLCTAVATLLRNFRAYAAVLAGYTAPLIGMSAILAPDRTFDIAIARVAAITVGVVCAGLVSSVFQPGGARRDLIARARSAVVMTLDLARDVLGRSAEPVAESRYVEATDKIIALDSLIEFAATESPRTARQANALRSAVAALIGAVTTLRAIADARGRGAVLDGALIGEFRAALDDLSRRLRAREPDLADVFSRLRAQLRLAAERAQANAAPSLDELQMLDNLDELAEQVEAVVLDLKASASGGPARTVASIGYHMDIRASVRNGCRAVLGVAAAGAFCYATGWSDGAQMLLAVSVVCSLLALTPNPAKASIAFALGTLLGDIAAIFCQFVLLARADGFPLLATAIAPFLIVGLLSPANRLLAGIAGGFRIFFVVALSPANPMTFDAAATLNNGLVAVVGAIFAAYVYRAVLPLNERAEAARLMRSIRDDLARAGEQPVGDRTATESRIYHRLVKLATRLDTSLPTGQALFAKAYAESRIALALHRARIALRADGVGGEARALLEKSIAGGARLGALVDAANGLVAMGGEISPTRRGPLTRAAAALAEAAAIADGRHGQPQLDRGLSHA